MIKRFAFLLLLLPLLIACSDDEQSFMTEGEGTLIIQDLRQQVVGTTAVATRTTVDPDLAFEILASDGNVYRGYQYAAGAELPDKFSLIPGDYTIHAYTENPNTWPSDNEGRGSAVHETSHPFVVEADWVTYVDVEVPLINYGVAYTVPEGFESWFPTCAFTVSGDGRTCSLASDQTAYFDPANDAGFTFAIHLVNADGEVFDIEPQNYQNPQAGIIYNVTLTFASDDDPTKLKIGISYDDNYEEIVHEITLY